jgi:hypothetical protein
MSSKKKTVITTIIAIALAAPMCVLVSRGLSSDKSIATAESETETIVHAVTVTDEMYQPERRNMKPMTVTTVETEDPPKTTTATTIATEKPTTTTTVTTETPVATETQPVVTMAPQEYRHFDMYVWAGDSRTVGFAACCGIAGESVLAKEGIGLNWCKENIESLYAVEGSNIVFNFGVNDLGNAYNYVDFYNSLPDEFLQKNQVFIMSVNPVDETIEKQKGYYVTNASIDNFNSILRDNLRSDIYFLDTNSYLKTIGISTWDGLHYNANTYQDILNYTIETITYVKE